MPASDWSILVILSPQWSILSLLSSHWSKCPEEARGALVPLNYQEYFGENLVKLSCFE